MFLIFISLVVFKIVKNSFEMSLTTVLTIMQHLKCKVYDDGIVVQELTAKQKEYLRLIVPK
jgi:hypothetical protein